ncbi:OmpA family protein [Emticicia sp. SJ17W-69]|uniref:OmpA family protein n=1 Tax=Emticicia sp. SJ17W-69 TaxID=3421657 RepID=UPI003EB6984F
MKKLYLICLLQIICKLLLAQNPDKVYANYDFVSGNKIIFEDDFRDDQNGEFPAHWKLVTGQGVLNKVNDNLAFFLTEGNYAVVTPRIKQEKYLSDEFTVEFDFIYKTFKDEGYGTYSGPIGLEFYYMDNYETSFRVTFDKGNVIVNDLQKNYPDELLDNFYDKWHHAAIVFKQGQMKTYIDQFRVCVNPSIDFKPYRLAFDGPCTENLPIIFKNVKIANGGGMNLIGKAFTDGKYISHGIRFDVNKAIIKAESMGEINGIVQILKENVTLKLEIGGHTDADGDDATNLKLSQLRADAVKTKLVELGIDATRLSTKGYGETKPIGDNKTFEGKTENRRVEFTKL